MYTAEMVSIAKREHNTKRSYLVVNKYQGKHIPVEPRRALDMFLALADRIRQRYPGERLLIIGFAETATAIGEALAAELDTFCIHTTREKIPAVGYLYFSESHSHATEQKLVKNDLDSVLGQIDRVIFAEDEVTTGNTIRKIVTLMRQTYGWDFRFSAASLLNGMDTEDQKSYEAAGIDLIYLVKTDHRGYPELVKGWKGNGIYHERNRSCWEDEFHFMEIPGYINGRRLHRGAAYQKACEQLCSQICGEIPMKTSRNILVLGTEEFMYPALYLGQKIQEMGNMVRCHATTRSPIVVSREPEYPLHERYELVSLYDKSRITYIYDLAVYDQVLVLTDAEPMQREGLDSLLSALKTSGNNRINVIRWC